MHLHNYHMMYNGQSVHSLNEKYSSLNSSATIYFEIALKGSREM